MQPTPKLIPNIQRFGMFARREFAVNVAAVVDIDADRSMILWMLSLSTVTNGLEHVSLLG
jgi:hypothetical protein